MELYLESFGTRLRAKDGLFEITVPDLTGGGNHRVEQFAPHQIRTILFHHHTSISADALHLAAESDTDVILCDTFGQPTGRFISTAPTNSVNILKAQMTVSNHAPTALGFARDWLAQKGDNQIKLLQRMASYRNAEAKVLIDKACTGIEKQRQSILTLCLKENAPQTAATLRGLEGSAQRLYFQTMSQLMPEDYRFDSRSRQPADDLFNALLNYAYGILYRKIETALTKAGLNPYIGFMHRDDYKRKSLVFDFIEPFRVMADRLVLTLCASREVNKQHIRAATEGGWQLNKEGKQLLAAACHEQWQERPAVANDASKQTFQQMMDASARQLAQKLLVLVPTLKVMEVQLN
jgi:CRISP-associated protein Cas1